MLQRSAETGILSRTRVDAPKFKDPYLMIIVIQCLIRERSHSASSNERLGLDSLERAVDLGRGSRGGFKTWWIRYGADACLQFKNEKISLGTLVNQGGKLASYFMPDDQIDCREDSKLRLSRDTF